MKNILIPTDFSENSWNALMYGISFFKKVHCTFHIVHVNSITTNAAEESVMYSSPDILEQTILKESDEKLAQLMDKINHLPLNPKHEFHTNSYYGFLTDHLKKEVKKNKIDLIVMGTKGASGLKSVAMGSNTGNVITKVPCTVLTVPEEATYKTPKEIGFPSDFQSKYETTVINAIKQLLLLNKSSLRFLYVALKGEELSDSQTINKDNLLTQFKELAPTFHKVTGKKIDDAIQCFMESRDLDLLVMVAKNLNFLERILFRPTVEKISYHTQIPFLVIHE